MIWIPSITTQGGKASNYIEAFCNYIFDPGTNVEGPSLVWRDALMMNQPQTYECQLFTTPLLPWMSWWGTSQNRRATNSSWGETFSKIYYEITVLRVSWQKTITLHEIVRRHQTITCMIYFLYKKNQKKQESKKKKDVMNWHATAWRKSQNFGKVLCGFRIPR